MRCWFAGPILLIAMIGLSQQAEFEEDIVVNEELTVKRHILDVRVIDAMGRPVKGLGAENFVLSQQGTPIPIVSCEWVGSPHDKDMKAPGKYPGQLIILFFQVQLDGHRVRGIQDKVKRAMSVLGRFHINDRIAVVSYDSHMRVRTDFTNNPEALARGIRKGLRRERSPYPKPASFPSLTAYLSYSDCKKARTPEKALTYLSNALTRFDDVKTLVYMSFDASDFARGNFKLREDYPEAKKALIASRTTVIGMDFAPWDYNTLDLAIRQFSEDTGGFFVKTPNFVQMAGTKLHNSLSGYYILSHESIPPIDPDGKFKLKVVGVKGKKLLTKSPYNSWGDSVTDR